MSCSSTSKGKDESKRPAKKKPEAAKQFNTGRGKAIIRAKEPDKDGNQPIRYVIRWEKTQLDYTLKQGASKGRFEKVTGALYRDGKIGCTFTADTANMDQDKKILVLQGNVTAVGIDPKARLECGRLEWKTDDKLLKAFGKVTIRFVQKGEATEGKIGPMDELWCLPDLERAGTPGFYR